MFYHYFLKVTVQPYFYVRIIRYAPSLAVFSRVFVSIQRLIKMAQRLCSQAADVMQHNMGKRNRFLLPVERVGVNQQCKLQ